MEKLSRALTGLVVLAALAIVVAGCGGRPAPASPVHTVNVFFDGLTHHDFRRVTDDKDIKAAASVIESGSTAALLVYENRWAAPLATALRRSGAQLVAIERVPVQALLAALDAAEARS